MSRVERREARLRQGFSGQARGEKKWGLSPGHSSGDCPPRIAVLASGNGSNLQALIDWVKKGDLTAEISLVLSNNPKAYALKRAKKAGITSKVVLLPDFRNRRAYDKELIRIIGEHKVDLVVLAGYMLICSEALVDEYYGRMINIHPALLPAFPGTDGIGDALDYGVKVTGVTVHFVDKGCDSGPIIFQESLAIKNRESRQSLAKRIHEIEHRLLPKAVKYFLEGRLKLNGRKVRIQEPNL